MTLPKLINIDGYENMCRQQVEIIFTIPYLPKSATITAPTHQRQPKNVTPTQDSRHKNVLLCSPQDQKNHVSTSSEGKTHLEMKKNFVSTTGFLECRQKHSKSNNSEIIRGFDIDEIIPRLFESLVRRY